MSKENGHLKSRRGIWQHVRDGRMSLQDVAVQQYIASQADTRCGIWRGSASALAGELCISPRIARRFLDRLTHGDYIRRFPIPGKHVCYPILVHKFEITDGEHRGEQLNALESISPVDLRYFPGEHRGEHVSSQKRIEKREVRKNQTPAAKPAPPIDPRHKPVFDSCFEAYREKYGVSPTWGGREGKSLQGFLKEHLAISASEIIRRYRNLLDSTDRWHADKHGSLSHLLSNFDLFADGPILAAPQKGGINADQRTHDNLAAAGLLPN